MKIKHPINLHKFSTFFFVLGLMFFYDNFTLSPWIYLALHGTYGFMWLMKDRLYPDRQWEEEVSTLKGLFVFLILGTYWIAPFLVVTRNPQPSPLLIFGAVATNIMGVLLHYGSDAQKYFTLKYKKGLITEGFFSRSRNPNYLGEILIYFSFCMLSQHWIPFTILGVFTVFVFVPNMQKKERSLSRYPEFSVYKKNSGLLFPKLFIDKSEESKEFNQG